MSNNNKMECVEFEQFIDLLAELILKYGNEVLQEIEQDTYEKSTDQS